MVLNDTLDQMDLTEKKKKTQVLPSHTHPSHPTRGTSHTGVFAASTAGGRLSVGKTPPRTTQDPRHLTERQQEQKVAESQGPRTSETM